MIIRNVDGNWFRHAQPAAYTFAYDAENRLVSVSGDATASFVFDGDGKRVLSTMDGATIIAGGNILL